MKIRFTYLLLLLANLLIAQNLHDTQGKLEISNAGQATFTLPIAMPPSLKNVGPIINLVYASGQVGGIAGQGWNTNSISTISRIATRVDLDGFRDGVDFDDNDKLALDGQRLILKTGTYWGNGSTYQTEVQSNTKVELYGSGDNIYFVVTTPDGSRSWYGNYNGNNATDFTNYYINRFEDANGNYMTYQYKKFFANTLCIDQILFSAHIAGINPINAIKFEYNRAGRPEMFFIKGNQYTKEDVLKTITVLTNNTLFKKYVISHTKDAQGYERVSKLQEFNAKNEPANPVLFEYDTTASGGQVIDKDYVNNIDINGIQLSGDFDGDGRLDFLTNNHLYHKIFQGGGGNTPINLPFVAHKSRNFTASTLTNNKLNQKNSVVLVTEKKDFTIFNTYNFNVATQQFQLANERQLPIVNRFSHQAHMDGGTNDTSGDGIIRDENGNILPRNCSIPEDAETGNQYFEGDFNGDGISEVLVFKRRQEQYMYHQYYRGVDTNNVPIVTACKYVYLDRGEYEECFYIDLNPAATNTNGGFVELSSYSDLFGDKRIIADFNSDGKSDIIVIKGQGYKIFTINTMLHTSNSVLRVELIGQGTLSDYSGERHLLVGDYNGDAKPDLMYPIANESSLWWICYANPKQDSTSEMFTKVLINSIQYHPLDAAKTFTDFNDYHAVDINEDGKSDIVAVYTNVYKKMWDINDHDTSWRVDAYLNNLATTNNFTHEYSSGLRESHSPQLPTAIVSGFRNQGIENNLAVVRPHHEKIEFYKFHKNFNQDNLLKKVTTSGGAIVNEISYTTLEPENSNGVYTFAAELNYPLVSLRQLPRQKIVSQLKNITNRLSLYQDFKYQDYIVNLEGLGTIGFAKTARSSWYAIEQANRVWSVTESDALLRGATTRSYTQLFSPGNAFYFMPASAPLGANGNTTINATLNVFEANTVNAIYQPLLKKQTNYDFLTGVVNETAYQYDPQFLLPTQTVSKNYTTANAQPTAISTTTTSFTNNPTGVGNAYYIGRPTSSETVVTAYNDTKKSSCFYEYTNNNLTKLKKRGNTSENKFLVESYQYNTHGNVTQKTVSTEGFTGPQIAPRSTTFTYDPSGRFVLTTTDFEGLVAKNNSFDPVYGMVTSQTNPYGLTTLTEIDGWGKPMKITDYLGKKKHFDYTRSGNIFKETITGDDGSSSLTETDVLGRIVKKGSKNHNNQWSYVSIDYDAFGRKTRETEPYFTQGTSLSSEITYDDYGRPKTTRSATDVTTTITYTGMAVMTSDPIRKKITIKDPNGNVVKVTDNLVIDSATDTQEGPIVYSYDATGNVIATNYDGTIIKTEYDEWGNKIKLIEPTAGTYTYSYYPTGELYQETTPKGTTTYHLDPATGKLKEKNIVGSLTNSKATYAYNAQSKLLDNLRFEDIQEGLTTTYTYTYDNFKRPIQTIEKANQSQFVTKTTYDNFGRPLVQTYIASLQGKTATSRTRNVYRNGIAYSLVSDTTNKKLWENTSVNEKGQLMTATYGNGIQVNNAYDQYGFPKLIRHSDPTVTPGNGGTGPAGNARTSFGAGDIMTLNYQFENLRGNLVRRDNSLFALEITAPAASDIQMQTAKKLVPYYDDFKYDTLDRLTQWGTLLQPVIDLRFKKFKLSNAQNFEEFVPLNEAVFSNTLHRLDITKSRYSNTPIWQEDFSITQRQILPKANSGEVIQFDLNLSIPNSAFGIKAVVVERDLITNERKEYWLKTFKANDAPTSLTHTVINNKVSITLKLYIEYYASLPSYAFSIHSLQVKLASFQNYDATGRITNNNIGEYDYQHKKYQNNKIHANYVWPADTFSAADAYNQNITYNALKKPVTITKHTETSNEDIHFTYNAFGERTAMYYGSMNPDKNAKPLQKYYSADGSMEIKYNTTTGAIDFVTYLGGDAYSAAVIEKSDGATQKYLYLHRDYQGSILAITNEEKQTVEKRLFDAWGFVIKVEDGNGNTLEGLTILDRGYTGHEHLQSVNLINMNARLYDARLHRFLQVDNLIQEPNNAQNYNRYAYCVNNPTKYTDVSGNDFGASILIGALVAAATYTLTALTADVHFSFGGLVQATFMGAVSGAVTCGIGQAFTTVKSFALRATYSALAHGTFQGAMSGVQGGKFWSSFASGAISSLAASAFQFDGNGATEGLGWANSVRGSTAGMIGFGTIMGGVGAAITKGNFWQGAVTGFIVSALNHAAHQNQIKNEIERKYPRFYKTLSKLKSFVKSNDDVLNTLSETSGFTPQEVLRLLSVKNLSSMILIEELGHWGVFRPNNPSKITIRASLIRGLEMVKLQQNIDGTSFFTAVTVLHEFVHYGRHTNGLSDMINIKGTNYEAGQVFETYSFGRILGLNGNSQIIKSNGWKF